MLFCIGQCIHYYYLDYLMSKPIHIVWFKRDLRITDHAALVAACNAGAVLPIFVWEPTVWAGEDYATQHATFIKECLAELNVDLKSLGLHLLESNLGIIDTLTYIQQKQTIAAIYSHEETGNRNTYLVDKAVAKWCKTHQINWLEFPQNGVVRRLGNRNHWNAHWEKRMSTPQFLLPKHILPASPVVLPKTTTLITYGEDKPLRQLGGRKHGLELLTSFLNGRASRYRGGISSPISAVSSGSRLSPYLAWGALSMREVVQAARAQVIKVADTPNKYPRGLAAGIAGFESRLHWHCHFMQKLESEPEIEYQNMHHAHDDMRDEVLADEISQRRLQAWCNGQTGWPLIDACMAMLRETGWVNFRMRATLMSTASYLYWLHWRQTGLHLSREFLDYEPGIHWSQAQMQSGTTGINTLRIYNPIKQAMDQDPDGVFVRHWLPALCDVPTTWIFEPWRMPENLQQNYNCVIGQDYPAPLVDIKVALKEARLKISLARKAENTAHETAAIIKKHASRKTKVKSILKTQTKRAKASELQQQLF